MTGITTDFNLERAINGYVRGKLTITQLERIIDHVLRGGYLTKTLEPRSPLMDQVRLRRRQRNCTHDDLIDITSFDGPRYICATCGQDSAPWLDASRPRRHTPNHGHQQDGPFVS